MIYWARKWVEKSHASYFLERRSAAQNKLHAKAPFPVCQNLFWQVCGSIIIDCQISINDLISVCMRVCACTEPEAILSNSREEGSRECVPTKPTPESTQHTPHSHGESRDRARVCVCNYLCINVFHAYMNILSIYSCMNQHMPDSYLNDHTGAGEVSCTFFCCIMNKSLCI